MLAGLLSAVAIASTTWGPAPCGNPAIGWGPVPPDAVAVADPVACTITVDRRLARKLRHGRYYRFNCTVIVHEWGHLTGHGHSADPMNVMYGAWTRPYWRCMPHKARMAPSWWVP